MVGTFKIHGLLKSSKKAGISREDTKDTKDELGEQQGGGVDQERAFLLYLRWVWILS